MCPSEESWATTSGSPPKWDLKNTHPNTTKERGGYTMSALSRGTFLLGYSFIKLLFIRYLLHACHCAGHCPETQGAYDLVRRQIDHELIKSEHRDPHLPGPFPRALIVSSCVTCFYEIRPCERLNSHQLGPLSPLFFPPCM